MEATHRKILEERLSAEGVAALERLVEEQVQRQSVSKQEFYQLGNRLDRVEQRLEGLEKETSLLRGELNTFRSDVDARFDAIHERLERMTSEFDARLDRMNERLEAMSREFNTRLDLLHDRMDRMQRWTLGVVTAFGVLISILVTLFKFL